MYAREAWLAASLLVALAGCGSGGSPASVPTLPAPGRGMVSTANESTIALPSVGGYGGTMTFAAGVPTASLSVTTSTTTSAAALRRKQSGTFSEFLYVTITPKATLTLPGLPSVNLTLPASYLAAGKHFYYGLQLPSPAGVYQQYRTEGPGLLDGSTVFFGASLQPYTLTAGQKYTFVFYADSYGATVDNLVFAGNAGSRGITAYPVAATGNTPPLRTISGSNTGISNLQAMAADVDGDLVVANVASSLTSSTIETFAEGANGNVKPIRSFSVPGSVSQIAVDPTNANIDVLYAGNISTYSPAGVLLQTIVPQPTMSGANGYYTEGVAVDKRGALIVSGENDNSDGYAVRCAIQVFTAGAKPSAPPSYVIALNNFSEPYCETAAYRRSVDDILIFSIYSTLLEFQNNASATLVRSGYGGGATEPFISALATDSTGDQIFVATGDANSVIRLVPSGSTFIVEPFLTGLATGLIKPVAIAVGAP